ncbi:phage tail tape measure protein [Rhodococcus sp. 2G]|uniref:phage tail tape measure protein n=1 Tax=Rhodococcus sp. 2G TaxID=1570939 RepID=UPI0009041622|nr:phage tail tape measure protein [Rhodococcus sp. 2G]APE10759.1 phage tail tape measure protein [Rhodococcus sp. 2G]
MPGGRIDIEVAPDLRDFPARLESGTKGALGVASKIGSALGLAIGAGAVGKAVIDLGNSFTTELNTLQAVSGATAEQLEAVKNAAMGLGNDNALADTSAVDAAAAMTELAKGGFTVEQSMTAARGTLQLAAAAQIDAASAATIQSQALQAFGLDADYAAKAADVLANGANASSAEITDVASGLQQAGAVANQFGVSLEDTVAGLGMLANAGIQGSDAGTLLKSTLLALTDQSNPAQGAIEDLGLTIYNASGEFVGFRELFGQLQEASASMTPEMYQAATATLFGSDAMRLAGVAAEQGTAGWDAMRGAIEREGAAADVAAAKTQGLPGAIAGVQNAAEGLALEVYDLVDGPLENLATKAGEFVTNATPGLISGLSGAADMAMSVGSSLSPVADIVGDLVGAFMDLPAPMQAVVAGFAAIKGSGLDDKIGGWVENAQGGLEEFLSQMDEVRQVLAENMLEAENPEVDASTFEGSLEQVNGLLEENEEQISEVAAAWGTMEARSPAIARMGDSYRDVTRRASDFATRQRDAATATGGLSGVLRNAGASVATFGGQVGGVAAAGMSGLKSAAGGVISAFGGPWMVGLAAAGMAVSSLVSNIQAAKQLSEQYDESLRAVAESQTDTFSTLVSNGGVIDDTVFGQLTQQIDGVSAALSAAADNDAKWNNVASDMIGDFIKPWKGAGDDISFEMDRVALANRQAQEAIESLGMSSDQIARKVGGTQGEWNTFRATLAGSGEGGKDAANKLEDLRRVLLEQQEASQRVTPGTYELSDAFALLADEAANADAKSSALKRALDALAGVPPDLQEATAAYNAVVRDTAEATQEVWDQSKGWGAALIGANGEVNTQTENGAALWEQLLAIRDATADVAAAGKDVGPQLAQNREQFEQLAGAVGLSAGEIETMARMLGYNESTFTISAQLAGADGVTAELGVVKTALDAVRPGEPKVIELQALTDDARARLEELGFKVDEITEDGVTTFRVEAETSLAQSGLDAVLAKLLEVGGVEAVPEIDADATRFAVTNEDVLAKLREIDTTQVDPAVGAVIDDFLAGRDVTLEELSKIDNSEADADVKLLIQQAIRDAQVVSEAIDAAAKNRTTQIAIEWSNRYAAARAANPDFLGPLSVAPLATGGQIAAGSRMPTTGPGTEVVDGIYAVTPDGTPVARVNGGEWVVNSRSSEKYDGLLAAINRDDPRLAGLPGFAEGGPIVMSMVRAVQSKFPGMQFTSGLRFTDNGYHSKDQAADFSDGFDSTPTMRSLAAWIADNYAGITLQLIHQPFDRNIGQGQGFVGDGLGFYGADTMADHRDHVHWAVSEPVGEPRLTSSDGSTDSRGRSRRARSTETWDTEDELKLDSARIAVVQAIEDRDKALNDPKKSQADKDQAKNKVLQAEEKVRKLEEQKSTAEQGGMAIPPAPELTTSYTDEELRLRDLERAVDEAKWDRDEIYADPEAAPWERDEADDKLQRAINALAEEQQEQRLAFAPEAPALTGRMTDEQLRLADLEDAVEQARLDRNAVYADPRSTQRERDAADRDLQKALNALEEGKQGGEGISGSSIAELFGNAAKAAVQGQLEDAFGTIGLTNGGSGAIGTAIGLGVEALTKQAQQGPAAAPPPSVDVRSSDADIGRDGRAREDWLKTLVESLKVPAVLRDVGGPVPHGMAALNLSGETEWVQTAADRRRYDRDMEELAVLRTERTGASGGVGAGQLSEIAGQLRQLVERPPIQHTSQYYGYEQAEAHRRERDRVDQYSRTYTRR